MGKLMMFIILNMILRAIAADEPIILDDMILDQDQYDELFEPSTRRNGIIFKDRLWPNQTVRFQIGNEYNHQQRRMILSTLDIIASKSCIKFEELFEPFIDADYVYIMSGYGCSANVGFKKGKQDVNLNMDGCLDVGRILHEFLHVLGFYHMHTTVNRDDFVVINWENIKNGTLQNFRSFQSEVSMLDTVYDYDSVTHYSPTTFSKNGLPTIVSKIPKTDYLMGQRDHLSEGDVTRINRLYSC